MMMMPLKPCTTTSAATSSFPSGTLLDQSVDMQTLHASSSSPRPCDTVGFSNDSFEEIRYSALVANTKFSPLVRVCYMTVYRESFEETRYSLWMAKCEKALALSPKEASLTMPLKYKDDGEFGKLGLGKEVEIESPKSRKALALSPKEGSMSKKTVAFGRNEDSTGNRTVDFGPKEGYMTTPLKYKDDRDFGKLAVGNGVGKIQDFSPKEGSMSEGSKEGSLTMPLRYKDDGDFGNLGVGNGVEFGSIKDFALNEFWAPNFDIVDDVNINKKDETIGGMVKEAVKKGQKRVKKEENKGELRRVEVRNLGSDIACSSPKCNFDSNIAITEGVEEKKDQVLREKVLMKGSKRARKQECSEDLEKAEMGSEAKTESPKVSLLNAFETQSSDIPKSNAVDKIDVDSSKAFDFSSLSTNIVKTRASNLLVDEYHGSHVMHTMEIEKANPFHDASENVNDDANTIAIKEQKTLSDVRRKKKVTESLERMDKEEDRKDLGKMEVDYDFQTPILKLDSDFGFPMETERLRPDRGATYTVEIENVKNNAEEMVKKKHVKELGKVGANKIMETESPNVSEMVEIEFSKSDTSEPKSSDILGIGNPGSHVVPLDSEKPNAENDGPVDTNASKDNNNSGILSLVEAEAESFSATIADDMALTGEMEASERRKRQKSEIFIGGLDKDAVEKDVRNSLQGEGDRAEVTVMMHEKAGEDNALSSPADAKKAKEKLGKVEVHKKQCSVSFDKNMIFLGSIDKKWKNEDVVKLLQEIGVKNIDKVTVLPDWENPTHNRGYAFIRFQTIIDAQTAFSLLEKMSIQGNQKIRVEWAKNVDQKKSDKAKHFKHACNPVIMISDNGNKKVAESECFVQLVRENASWRQPQRSPGVGKRQFSHLLVPYNLDPRWYPRPWTESCYPAVNPRPSPGLRMQSLPYCHLRGSSYPSGLTYGADGYFNRSQIRGSPPMGANGVYPRY